MRSLTSVTHPSLIANGGSSTRVRYRLDDAGSVKYWESSNRGSSILFLEEWIPEVLCWLSGDGSPSIRYVLYRLLFIVSVDDDADDDVNDDDMSGGEDDEEDVDDVGWWWWKSIIIISSASCNNCQFPPRCFDRNRITIFSSLIFRVTDSTVLLTIWRGSSSSFNNCSSSLTIFVPVVCNVVAAVVVDDDVDIVVVVVGTVGSFCWWWWDLAVVVSVLLRVAVIVVVVVNVGVGVVESLLLDGWISSSFDDDDGVGRVSNDFTTCSPLLPSPPLTTWVVIGVLDVMVVVFVSDDTFVLDGASCCFCFCCCCRCCLKASNCSWASADDYHKKNFWVQKEQMSDEHLTTQKTFEWFVNLWTAKDAGWCVQHKEHILLISFS